MKKIIKPNFEEEKKIWDSGVEFVIGLDEVGRGAFAGPIVAAGVVFNSKTRTEKLCDINDSKLLKPNLRKKCAEVIKENALFWTVEKVGVSYINKHGIGKANSAVFRKILNKFLFQFNDLNHFVLIDGFHKKYLPGGLKKQKAIIKGDRKSLSIASASIIAKVYRDNLMREISSAYPDYNFGQNKGYGTKFHRKAVEEFGISKLHRISFVSKFSNL
ncbi:MAG: ribonuclease HII [Candidatus Levybacteria bacterium]|nr:ribonuclease HII [Candidatus Levybacteria bacterium]